MKDEKIRAKYDFIKKLLFPGRAFDLSFPLQSLFKTLQKYEVIVSERKLQDWFLSDIIRAFFSPGVYILTRGEWVIGRKLKGINAQGEFTWEEEEITPEVLYVGMSDQPLIRALIISRHHKLHKIPVEKGKILYVTIIPFEDRKSALQAETYYIEKFRPHFNQAKMPRYNI